MNLDAPMFEDSSAGGRRAQLLLAALLLSLIPIFLQAIPIQTHSVKLDLPRLPEAIVPGPAPRFMFMSSLALPRLDRDIVPARAVHALAVTPEGRILFDGSEVDVVGLRTRLDLAEAGREWVDFRPDPHARYELFLETLAVIRRARLERLRLDSRPFRTAIDDAR